MKEIPHWIASAYIGVIGLVVGSFLNVVIARLPAGESLWAPRSRCPACKAPIAWYDNIPLLSWVLLCGRCRRCKASIAARYPIVEVLNATLWLGLWERLGWRLELALWLPLAAALLALTFLDIDHFWLPDRITVPAMLWALAWSFAPGGLSPIAALLGLLPALGLWAFAWLFARLFRREGMGGGDIKLLAVLGLALGAGPALAALILGSLQGALIGGVALLSGGHRPKDAPPKDAPPPSETWVPPPRAVPFGPFLVLGAFEVVLLPEIVCRLPEQLAGFLGAAS